MDGENDTIDFKLRLFGGFVEKERRGKKYLVYEGGFVHWKYAVPVSYVRSVMYLRFLCNEGLIALGFSEAPKIYSLWYKERGKTWATGKRRIDNDDDVRGFLESKHSEGHVELFQTVGIEEWDRYHPPEVILDNPPTSNPSASGSHPPHSNPTGPSLNATGSGSQQPNSHPSQSIPSETNQLSNLESNPVATKTPKPNKAHVSRRSPRNAKPVESKPPTTEINPPTTESKPPTAKFNPLSADIKPPSASQPRKKLKARKPIQSVCRRSPRFNKDSVKGGGTGSSSTDVSDLDLDWKAGEEDLEVTDDEEEQWHIQTKRGLVG
ncbi:circumsporozoite protein-like [Chenopodium quinoa]|uniref:circumsporozoite protein-like n=1 Tax=Chenopodium quinoa TaxID=63459 RepID=UPI000B76C447|nr:circumsporozoite protein-like [Chenopodium quinoa]